MGEEIVVPSFDPAADGEPIDYVTGTIVDVRSLQGDGPGVVTLECDGADYLVYRDDESIPDPSLAIRPSHGRSRPNRRPHCSEAAVKREGEGRHGIECPHCGHTEAFGF